MRRHSLTLILPLCSICRYKHQDTLNYRKSVPACDVLPNGIPEAVRKNGMEHRRTISGDNGIHFELAADTEPLRQLLSSFDNFFRKQGLKPRMTKQVYASDSLEQRFFYWRGKPITRKEGENGYLHSFAGSRKPGDGNRTGRCLQATV